MSRIGNHNGYLIIDHRNSPGIPESMAPQVAAQGGIPVPGNTAVEVDTWTCAHCNASSSTSRAPVSNAMATSVLNLP